MASSFPFAAPLDDEPIDTIGQRIKATRKRCRLNQENLGRELGVSQPTVANWEADIHQPRPFMLGKLADRLEVTVGWLAGGDEGGSVSVDHPMASYLRRPLRHVPIYNARPLAGLQSLVNLEATFDPIDFLPVSSEADGLVALIGMEAPLGIVPPGRHIFVIDPAPPLDPDKQKGSEDERRSEDLLVVSGPEGLTLHPRPMKDDIILGALLMSVTLGSFAGGYEIPR